MNWPALLVAPALALANLTITYAMVTPSCARQNAAPLSIVSVLILLACLAMSFVAWRNWYRQGALEARTSDDAEASSRFVALVSAMVGTLSSLVVVAMWFPQWVLSPCYN